MIAVPSKGRAGKSQTLAALEADQFTDVTVIVPRDEVLDYSEAHPNPGWHIYGQHGKGIADARQEALILARKHEWGAYWMLDDDITGWFWKVGGKLVKTEIGRALTLCEDILHNIDAPGPVALMGPNFRHRAWSGPHEVWDVNLRNVVWVEPEAPINYWPHLKEDLDAVLQALSQGWHTLCTSFVAFDSPQMGTSQGGCRDDYDAGKLDDACRALVEKWPGVVDLRLDDKTGRLTNRVNWKAARA